MSWAKISANGQITLPVEIRRQLGLKPDDKILFYQKKSGEIIVYNARAEAIAKAQAAFMGAANAIGIVSKKDVQAL